MQVLTMLIFLLHRVAEYTDTKSASFQSAKEEKEKKNHPCFARWLIQGPQQDSGRPKLENKAKK